MIKNYFLSEHLNRNPLHGGISNKHIEITLLEEGFIPIEFPHPNSFSLYSKCIRFLFLIKTFLTIPGNAAVVFQFPVYARMATTLIRMLRYRKSIRMIALIMDVDGLRDNNPYQLQKEIGFLKKFDRFIVHNDSMKKWFIDHGIKGEYAVLQAFELLVKSKTHLPVKSCEIAYAGNLDKAPFLSELATSTLKGSDIHLHLYGVAPGFPVPSSESITYYGGIEPAHLTAVIKGAFGLIWEGDSPYALEGAYAHYTRINTPNKLSLYILSGMPVICHEEMAIARYVKEWEIGVTVESLSKVAETIHSITDSHYQQMQENCVKLSPKVNSGYFTMTALTTLLKNTEKPM